ncbi:MAG: alpha/beta fold hydrolase [Kiloniellales bacterium]
MRGATRAVRDLFEGFESRRIALADAEIFLRLGGSGPPLLLLHGFPQNHRAWHQVAPLLARDFTLVIPDLRGYGASRGPEPDAAHRAYSKRAMAEDMAAAMDELGYARFALAGHDRGARVGYRLCLDRPERVTRFAALDIVPTLDVWESLDADKAHGVYHWMFLAAPAPVPERLIAGAPEFYIRHLLDLWAGDRAALDPEAVALYCAQYGDSAVIAASCADYRAGATTDRADDAADRAAGRKIACPVLALWGGAYLSAKADSVVEVWRRWTDDVSEVALDCGHFLAEERPQETAAALREFFGASR